MNLCSKFLLFETANLSKISDVTLERRLLIFFLNQKNQYDRVHSFLPGNGDFGVSEEVEHSNKSA